MQAHRSLGMTAVGLINLAVGALSIALAVFLFCGGSLEFLGRSGAAMLLGGAGLLLLLVGLLPFCFGVLFTISGVGVLKMAPWGRTISILAGSVMAALCVQAFVEHSVSAMGLGLFAYCCGLVILCYTPRWRMVYAMRPVRSDE